MPWQHAVSQRAAHSLPPHVCCAAVYPDGRVCISILHNPGDDPNGYETAAERWSPVQSVRFTRCGFVATLATMMTSVTQHTHVLGHMSSLCVWAVVQYTTVLKSCTATVLWSH